MASAPLHPSSPRHRAAVVLLMLAALLATAGVSILKHKDYADPGKLVDDDYVWLYMTGAALGREPVFLGAWNQYLQEASRVGADVVDAAARDVYRFNYLAASALYRATADVVARFGPYDRVSQYPDYMGVAMYWGFQAAFGVALLVTLSVLLVGLEPPIILASLVAVTLMALAETVVAPINQYVLATPTGELASWSQAFVHGWHSLVNPHANFSPFGVTPRSQFTMLVLGIFALRLGGRFASAYLLLGVAALFHQSYGMLLLGLLLTADIVLRPQVLRPRPVIAAALGCALLTLLRPQIVSVSGHTAQLIVAPAIAALAVLLLANAARPSLERWLPVRIPFVRALGTSPLGDPIFLLLAWALTVVAVISYAELPQQALHFWAQLHGRWMGIMRPGILLSVSVWVLARLMGRTRTVPVAAVVIAACLASFAYVFAPVWETLGSDPLQLQATMKQKDGEIQITATPGRIGTEIVVYYVITKTLETGQDWTNTLYTPDSPARR